LGFGIRAPFAGKGAALEKDHRSDAGAVMEAEFLNVKEETGIRHSPIIYLYELL
jgi:hypothetical protein